LAMLASKAFILLVKIRLS